MKVCLLTTQDLDADPFPEDDWPCDPRPFMPEATWELVVLEKPTAVKRIIALSQQGFDVFFNLCDGAWDEETPGIEVVQTLERLNVPFTGSNSAFYEPTRAAMKRACFRWGIDAPVGLHASTDDDIERALTTLRFPMFVKHHSSYASVGLTRQSRVTTRKQLFRQAREMIENYGGALIEEFIEGIECTVLVAENPEDPEHPTTYLPMQYRFPEGESFKHADMKWVDYDAMQCVPVEDAALAERLRDAAAKLFVGLRGAGFGRCDVRVDAEGRPYILEINANCGVYYPPSAPGGADLCLMADPAGHEGFTRQLVAAALASHARRARRFVTHMKPDGSFGIYAARDLAPGDLIIDLEGAPMNVVSRAHVERTFSAERRAQFAASAWPVTEELWVVWGDDPEHDQRVGHSCDPNAWFEGLDIVARRAIAAGEEVTLDHATFRAGDLPSFQCACGATDCRGTIRGDDYLGDFMNRYGDHASDFVRTQRG
ncbi:MAG: hypothetical protein DRJ42_25050, partial [Deltaproteobacteria bacterium]